MVHIHYLDFDKCLRSVNAAYGGGRDATDMLSVSDPMFTGELDRVVVFTWAATPPGPYACPLGSWSVS